MNLCVYEKYTHMWCVGRRAQVNCACTKVSSSKLDRLLFEPSEVGRTYLGSICLMHVYVII